MSVRVADRDELTLELVHEVAWRGERLEIAPAALELMDRCHESFETFVADRIRADPGALIYGVTSAPGDSAVSALSEQGQADRPSQLWTAMPFGEPLPARVVRAIIVARLANMLRCTSHRVRCGRSGPCTQQAAITTPGPRPRWMVWASLKPTSASWRSA